MLIAPHPSTGDKVVTLEPLHFHLHGGKLPDTVKQKLEEVVRQRDNICGVVVSWPLQKDTGHMGAPCGRTLHILEELLEETDLFSSDRPLCLWDSQHPTICAQDKWGRCADFARTTEKHTHLASKEQYNQDDNVVATQVWNDFVRVHWPTIYRQRELYSSPNNRRQIHRSTNNHTTTDPSSPDDERDEPTMAFS